MLRRRELAQSLLLTGAPFCSSASAMTCRDLKSFHAADTTVEGATEEKAPYSLPVTAFGHAIANSDFCRVEGYLTPTSGSHIKFEVWLPNPARWNHKFEGTGNGGWSGDFNYSGMINAFDRGYATMTTDQGHTGVEGNKMEDVTWAVGHPERIIDYA